MKSKAVILRHSSDAEPGITRKRIGRHWAYFDPDGNRITDAAAIDRLNALGLPPAYRNAWFCLDPDGHLQATGIDARGRKQYRYHSQFREFREKAKFDGLLEFGRALPKLRRRVEQDLKRRELSEQTVLAAVVRLLDSEHIRVGNEEYARTNKSFGATTLRSRHLRRRGKALQMRFPGKNRTIKELTITDTHLKRVIRRLQELPGQILFQYAGDDGQLRHVTSTEVNAYIKAATGKDFTAKHFRTWGASVIAFSQMLEKARDARISVKTVIEPVAEALGNTPAISRKAYVHPRLLEALREDPHDPLHGLDPPPARARLSSAEVGLLQFLKSPAKRRKGSAA